MFAAVMRLLYTRLASRVRARPGFCRVLLVWLVFTCFSCPAQWLTQSIPLTNGWNAVYLHVDASHTNIQGLLDADPANPILEVWQWRPAPSTLQFIQNPQSPVDNGSQWAVWTRVSPDTATLQRLVGNTAYLVRLSQDTTAYTWSIRGKVVAPVYSWTSTGLNFLGFPTPASQPPTFEQFLSPAPHLRQQAEIFHYPGGDLGTNNPARVFTLRNAWVRRGQAFWVRSGTSYNHYFGPFETVSGANGIDFGENSSVRSLRLRNLTAAILEIRLQLVASEDSPAGQPLVRQNPPLILRGSLRTNDFTYDSIPLGIGHTHSLTLAPQSQPGSEVELVVGLNRSEIAGAPGDVCAGILRVTDTLGYSQVDLPVTAVIASTAGLWVGRALVGEVGSYLKAYARDEANQPIISSNGAYIVTSTNTGLGRVARPFPLQLIVHSPEGAGSARLLQRAYYGLDAASNVVVSTKESALNSHLLDRARRLSTSHLPWSEANPGWAFNGNLGQNAVLTATVDLAYDDQASNPFLHTYHPDHDNRDATFEKALPQGAESYSVRRQITLGVRAPGTDFASLTTAGRAIQGDYHETISVSGLVRDGGTPDERHFEVRGAFVLNRLLAVPVLTTLP